MLFRLLLKRREETEDFDEIEELTMNIAYTDNGLLNEDDIGLVF